LRLKREAKGNEIINEKEEEKRKALAKRFISKDEPYQQPNTREEYQCTLSFAVIGVVTWLGHIPFLFVVDFILWFTPHPTSPRSKFITTFVTTLHIMVTFSIFKLLPSLIFLCLSIHIIQNINLNM
jgi:hypothetical protein